MKSENSKSSKLHVFQSLAINYILEEVKKDIALSNLSIYYAWENIRKIIK